MDDDVEVSMNGQVYLREDFEDPKQSLTNHQWIPEEVNFYFGSGISLFFE